MQELLGTPSKAEAIHEAEDVPEMMAVPGIFLGLRVALLFNLGLCIAAAVGYEVWTIATK
ncbi:hypothetical protein [Acidipila sp. EB88]|uniref:hypothetical protein n=1 Tax=Acidipila sp. EB88 TaxID=2305226 RepID=UPI000F5F4118|nr:hypothetical protein [Acidipila sp. EB88]